MMRRIALENPSLVDGSETVPLVLAISAVTLWLAVVKVPLRAD